MSGRHRAGGKGPELALQPVELGAGAAHVQAEAYALIMKPPCGLEQDVQPLVSLHAAEHEHAASAGRRPRRPAGLQDWSVHDRDDRPSCGLRQRRGAGRSMGEQVVGQGALQGDVAPPAPGELAVAARVGFRIVDDEAERRDAAGQADQQAEVRVRMLVGQDRVWAPSRQGHGERRDRSPAAERVGLAEAAHVHAGGRGRLPPLPRQGLPVG